MTSWRIKNINKTFFSNFSFTFCLPVGAPASLAYQATFFFFSSKPAIHHCVITEVKPGWTGLALGWVTTSVSWVGLMAISTEDVRFLFDVLGGDLVVKGTQQSCFALGYSVSPSQNWAPFVEWQDMCTSSLILAYLFIHGISLVKRCNHFIHGYSIQKDAGISR